MAALTRDDVIDGLADVVRRLRQREAHATIRIVGGAAMMLRYFHERQSTVDVDAGIISDSGLAEVVLEVAALRGWPTDWLNPAAEGFIPFAGPVEWVPVYADDSISIGVATPECLLAMKLRSGRRGRDDEDVAVLMSLLRIDRADEAERIFDTFYPGEVPPQRALEMLADIFAAGLPDRRELLDLPDLGSR